MASVEQTYEAAWRDKLYTEVLRRLSDAELVRLIRDLGHSHDSVDSKVEALAFVLNRSRRDQQA